LPASRADCRARSSVTLEILARSGVVVLMGFPYTLSCDRRRARSVHHSSAFTLAIYGHLFPQDRRRNVDMLDDRRRTRRDPTHSGATTRGNSVRRENEGPATR
jgi:hypothetical protein